jgi:hypothetical protein
MVKRSTKRPIVRFTSSLLGSGNCRKKNKKKSEEEKKERQRRKEQRQQGKQASLPSH